MTALPKALNKRGVRAARWADWQKKQRAIVMMRCRGRCEACHEAEATEWQHCFGRRHIIAEPLASHHVMTAGLCRECHRQATRDGDIGDLREIAIGRAIFEWHLAEACFHLDGSVDDARELERYLRADDVWQKLEAEAGR